jgi:hypothetical protein
VPDEQPAFVSSEKFGFHDVVQVGCQDEKVYVLTAPELERQVKKKAVRFKIETPVRKKRETC